MFLIKKVRFKNFRSYGNQFTEINLVKNKNTVIIAPNGSGKSTILMAIEYGLFGKVSSGINKSQLINTINNKDLVVEIECEAKGKKILIRRGMKPNIFEIYIDGKLINQDASVRDYQALLEEEILGFNLTSFSQVVSISGSSYIPFLLLSAGQRRKIVEELLNLTIISKMHAVHLGIVSQVKEQIQNVENELQKKEASLASLKKSLETFSEQEDNYRKAIEDNIKQACEKIRLINEDIDEKNQEINKLEKECESYENKLKKKNKLSDYKRDIKNKILEIQDYIEFLKSNDICPTCSQSISAEFKKESLETKESKKNNLLENLKILDETLEKTQKDLEKMEEILAKIKVLENDVYVNIKRASDIQLYIFEQQKILENKTPRTNDIIEEINKISKEISNLKQKRLELLEEKQYNDIISLIIKDNGIKSKIISQYISKMNRELNKYLELLDVGISIDINENFEAKIFSRFRDELSYPSFSAGERARIDISFLFTWRELAKAKNSLNCNLLFLDEIFDSVLDEQGFESFINLLRFHLKDTNVFLISHRQEAPEKFENILRISKTSNFSRIE